MKPRYRILFKNTYYADFNEIGTDDFYYFHHFYRKPIKINDLDYIEKLKQRLHFNY